MCRYKGLTPQPGHRRSSRHTNVHAPGKRHQRPSFLADLGESVRRASHCNNQAMPTINSTKLRLSFGSRRHEGVSYSAGAYEACHDVYDIGGRVFISLSTYGRMHGGTITIRFHDAFGQRCSYKEWRRCTWKPLKKRHKLEEGKSTFLRGLAISLSSSGRSHSASAEISGRQPQLYCVCKVKDVASSVLGKSKSK